MAVLCLKKAGFNLFSLLKAVQSSKAWGHLNFQLKNSEQSKEFCLTVPKNFAGEPFSAVLQKFPVAKKFMDKRGGEYQDFPSKIFCLTLPKNIVKEPFSVSLISGIKKC